MAKVNLSQKPQGFRLMPAGVQVLRIDSVEGLPRANVTNVHVKFRNAEGITLDNRYDLTNPGGYAAFYYLVTNGCGFNIDDGEFDIDQLIGQFVEVEIVHRDGTRAREDGTYPTFANIKATLGAGDPFEDAGDDPW